LLAQRACRLARIGTPHWPPGIPARKASSQRPQRSVDTVKSFNTERTEAARVSGRALKQRWPREPLRIPQSVNTDLKGDSASPASKRPGHRASGAGIRFQGLLFFGNSGCILTRRGGFGASLFGRGASRHEAKRKDRRPRHVRLRLPLCHGWRKRCFGGWGETPGWQFCVRARPCRSGAGSLAGRPALAHTPRPFRFSAS